MTELRPHVTSYDCSFRQAGPPGLALLGLLLATMVLQGCVSSDNPPQTIVPNTAPVANAGPPQTVFNPATVTLDGTGTTDADQDSIFYSWVIESKPAGSAATLSDDKSAHPTFQTDALGDYVIRMTADDHQANGSSTAAVTITAIPPPPIANAGADFSRQFITPPLHLQLDGTQSNDPSGLNPPLTLTYDWQILTFEPAVGPSPSTPTVTLTGNTTTTPSFDVTDVSQLGRYTVQLTVGNGTSTATDTVVVNVTSVEPPVANAGPDQQVTFVVGSTVVQLDGSASSDPGNLVPLSYSWQIVSFVPKSGTPPAAQAALVGANTVNPSFAVNAVDQLGTYTVRLTATNTAAAAATDDVVIQVDKTFPAGGGLLGSGLFGATALGFWRWLRRRRVRLAMAAAAAIATAVPSVFVPTSSYAQLEEIVVSTRKKEENLQDVPVAVAAFSSEAIEKQGLASTADIVKLIPGVQFDQAFSAADTRISIRGINSTRGRASVAILVDGVDVSGENVSSGGGSSLLNSRLLDLERVEVLKGPQAALYGRNAFAGAINYISKKPNFDGLRITTYGDFTGRYGIYDFRGSISGPVVTDKLALSFNAGTYKSDGYYRNNNPNNPAANVGLGGSESNGLRLAAYWKPTEDLNVLANLSYTVNKSEPRAVAKVGLVNTFYGLNGQKLNLTASDYRGLNICKTATQCTDPNDPSGNNWYSQFEGTVHTISPDAIDLSISQRNNGPFKGSQDKNLFGFVKADWTLGPVQVKSRTSYMHNDAFLDEDVDFQDGVGTPVFRPDVGINTFFSLDNEYLDKTKTQYIEQEFTVESTSWERGRWLVGVDGFWEDTDNKDFSLAWFNAPNFAQGFPSFCPAQTALQLACRFRDSVRLGTPAKNITRNTKSYSAFALVGFNITDALHITGEARYINDNIKVCTNSSVDRVSQMVLAFPIDWLLRGTNPVITSLPTCDSQRSDTINPRLSLDYKVTDNALIYAAAAKGTKPAGFGTSQMAIPQAVRIKQEQLWAYELGAKTDWFDRRVQANGALFFNDYTDRQIGITVEDPNSGFASAGVTNAGGAQTYGIELDVAWKPLEELTVGIAYAWTHAQWTDYNLAKIRDDAAQGPFGTPPSESIKARDRANCQNPQRDCSGAPISGIPEHAASFTANYTSRLTDSIDWFTNFTMEFEGKRALQEWKNAPYVGSYFIENLQAGVQTEDWSVQLYVDNLLDNNAVRWAQVYQDFRDGMYGGGSGGEPRDVTVYAFLPPPRVFGVRATYHFGAK